MKRFFQFPLVGLIFFFTWTLCPLANSQEGSWLNSELSRGFSHESEVGVVATGGNTVTSTYNAAQISRYGFSKNLFSLQGSLLLGSADNILSSRSWSASLRYDRFLTGRLSIFTANKWEGDTFAGYAYRINQDLGLKYYWILTDKENYFFSELGYRYRNEHTVEDVVKISHIARGYLEAQGAVGKYTLAKIWVEALPDLVETNDYQINFEPSLQVRMSKYLFLKTAYLGQFDHEPAVEGLRKYDFRFTTSVSAKI